LLMWSPVAIAMDPWKTMPDVMRSGVALPGDAVSAPCPVQKDFAQLLMLAEAVDLALCNNPQIQAAWADIKIQAAALGEARASYLPTLAASLGRVNEQTDYSNSNVAPSEIQSNTTAVTLSWRLFDFGTRTANRRAAENTLVAALASHNSALQKVLTSVVQAYFEAITTRAVLSNKTQNEQIAQSTLESARRHEAKGATAQSETLQATTALAKVTLEKNRAQGAHLKALSVLMYSLGVPNGTYPVLPEELNEKVSEEDRDLTSWLSETEKNHPAIVAVRAQLDAAKERVIAAQSDGLPTVDFSGNYYQNGRPGQSLAPSTSGTTLSVSLTIPIFDGFSRNYKTRGAQAQVERKEAELADTEQGILRDVVNTYADNISAIQNMEASAALLTAAKNALAISRRKYNEGAADILEMLNTQSALADAQQERVRCLSERRSARFRLLASAGRMSRSVVEK
jgi:outer membrane protein